MRRNKLNAKPPNATTNSRNEQPTYSKPIHTSGKSLQMSNNGSSLPPSRIPQRTNGQHINKMPQSAKANISQPSNNTTLQATNNMMHVQKEPIATQSQRRDDMSSNSSDRMAKHKAKFLMVSPVCFPYMVSGPKLSCNGFSLNLTRLLLSSYSLVSSGSCCLGVTFLLYTIILASLLYCAFIGHNAFLGK